MSYPPRPPMMPHGMPPMIHQPPFNYNSRPPMGMPPMGMMMNRPPPNLNQAPPNFNRPPGSQSPITKVFVGNISERAPDNMIRQMLQRCGAVLNWKRVEGTNGKLQAFGFCEFLEPQFTLRCIRLLNGYEIAEKKLLVKVDQKTRELLGEYIIKHQRNGRNMTKNAKKAASLRNIRGNLIRPPEDGEIDEEDDPKNINLEAVDEDTLKEDRGTIGALELILRQYAKDLDPPEAMAEIEEKIHTVEPPPITVENQPENKEEKDFDRKDGDKVFSGVYMKPHLRLETITLDDDKKEYMTSEISKFRETHKDEDVKIKQEEQDRLNRAQDRKENRDRPKNESNGREQRRSRDREDRDRNYSSRHRSPRDLRDIRDSRPVPGQRPRSRSREVTDRSREVISRRERRPSTEENLNRDRSNISPDRRYKDKNNENQKEEVREQRVPQTSEEIEEERERKKLERRLREKELAYRARLKLWEEREGKKRRGYLSEKKNEMQKRKILLKDTKKLRQFMEDYDDEKDDSSYFKGQMLERKLKFREKEIESDNRDRQREKDELEELKKRLSEKGFSDVDIEAERIQVDENLRMKIKFEKMEQSSESSEEESDNNQESEPENKHGISENESNSNNNNNILNGQLDTHNDVQLNNVKNELNNKDTENNTRTVNDDDEKMVIENEENENKDNNHNNDSDSNSPAPKSDNYLDSPSSNSPTFFGKNNADSDQSTNNTLTIRTVKKSIQPVNQAFADEDGFEPSGPQFKRLKLLSSSEPTGMSSEDRKKAVKKLVESIPTDRDELFAYEVAWDQLDENLMEKRIKPWINKKIIEYIGEEEATLNDFICSKIQQRTEPAKLLEEIKVILDDEAELFVKKMWRLIVYETESKRCGLSK